MHITITVTHQPLELETQLVSVSCEWFSLCGAIVRLPTLHLACTNTHISWGVLPFSTSRSASVTYTSRCVLESCLIHTHTHTHARLLAQTQFLFYAYMSVSLHACSVTHNLAYLFHQYGTSLLSRDGRITDGTVRRPGEERPFSSFSYVIYR